MQPETHLACCPAKGARTVLELTVSNHPGVMSHVCGLFSRRGYNVEGIACVPIGDGSESLIWLAVNEQERLEHVEAQLRKLQDVRAVTRSQDGGAVFAYLQRVAAPHCA